MKPLYLVVFIFAAVFGCSANADPQAFVPQSRTITIQNKCQDEVLWGITGTPIQTQGGTVSCATPGSACSGWSGSVAGDEGICGGNNLCYFKYPQLTSTPDSKPYFVLASNQTRTYTVSPVTRLDKNGKTVVQYSFNIGPQFNCELDAGNGIYACKSAPCGGRNAGLYDGQCVPEKGMQPPFTQIEMTTNDAQNDFYDLSIINGANLPVKIEAVGTPGNQNFQSNFWCTTPGDKPSVNPGGLNGCSWAFVPPNFPPLKQEVFVQIDRDSAIPGVPCANDSDCSNNQKCGLKYPEDLKSYTNKTKPAYCGTPLGFYTVTQICSLGGLASDLKSMFQCASGDTVTLKNSSGMSKTVTNTALYQCATDGEFLDSCYNYLNKPYSTSSFCCGCIDWDGVPTDDQVQCAKAPSSSGPTTSTVFPNADWLSLVKPKLQWLMDACPDAYEYQYGDKHGTIQCSTESVATNSGNSMNYKITFCPQGTALFPASAVGSISIESPKATVLSTSAATLQWSVKAQPSSASFTSAVELEHVSGSNRTCSKEDCVVEYTNLSPGIDYVAKISGNITVNGNTTKAADRYVTFKTDSSPSVQSVIILNEMATALSSSSFSVRWDIKSTPAVQVDSNASATLIPSQGSNLKYCDTTHCEVTFTNLNADTNYQVEINALGGGTKASPKVLFVKTKNSTNSVIVAPPSKGDMKLTNVVGPGAYCSPTVLRFPYLSSCQSVNTGSNRCVLEQHQQDTIGEWYINQLPSCIEEANYEFSHLNGFTAVYRSSQISFRFYPNATWKCTPAGSHLSCVKI